MSDLYDFQNYFDSELCATKTKLCEPTREKCPMAPGPKLWEPQQLISIDDLIRSAGGQDVAQSVESFNDLLQFEPKKQWEQEQQNGVTVTKEMTAAEVLRKLIEYQQLPQQPSRPVTPTQQPSSSSNKTRRRAVNNQAALRCRLKRKNRMSSNMQLIKQYEEENPKLKQKLRLLEEQRNAFSRKLAVFERLID